MHHARNRRKILCVFPAYAPSFGTFEYAYALRGTTRAFMPPRPCWRRSDSPVSPPPMSRRGATGGPPEKSAVK